MMSRREAYFGALKYWFQNYIISEHKDPRTAYRLALYWAADYAFHVPSKSL